MSYRANKLFALPRNGKESENRVLWPWHLVNDIEIQQYSCGGQDAYLCKISSSKVQRTRECTRFRTTVDLDREYFWNGSSNRQAENGVMNCDFFPRSVKTIWWTLVTKKWLWPWNSIGLLPLSRYVFLQNFLKLRAAAHELSWSQRKKKDENNTVRRYRADNNNAIL